jgi:ABC transporter C-terminal domain
VLKARQARQGEASQGGAADSASRETWEQQKRRRNRLSKLPVERDKVLASIAAAEARGKEIEALYCSEGFFERTSAAEVEALEQEKTALVPQIEELMARWEALEQELAGLQAEEEI